MTQLYYRLFYFLELEGLLDPLNHKHLFALRYVYKPRIQRSLDQFKDGWNNHNIRAECNRTLYQLHVHSALMLQWSGLVTLDFFETVSDNYGVDEAGFATTDNSSSGTVDIYRVEFDLSKQYYSQLTASIDPLKNNSIFSVTFSNLTSMSLSVLYIENKLINFAFHRWLCFH